MNSIKDVYVIGLGYVGLTLAAKMAQSGLNVIGIDKSEKVLNSLKNGNSHFYEKEIDLAIKEVINKKLKVTNKLEKTNNRVAYIISVGTPVDPATKKPIMAQIDSVLEELATVIKAEDLIILRSTVPIGASTDYITKKISELTNLKIGEDILFAFAPERTIEGKAMFELSNLPQIIGAVDQISAETTANLFKSFNEDIVIMPDVEHAEMLKTIDNSFRDVMFAYANQMALICEHVGLNYSLIREVANYNYPRNNVAMSSPGVGGACLTKDPYLLIDICKKKAINSQLILAGRQINEYVPYYLANQIVSYFEHRQLDLKKAKVLVLGVAFKGNPPTSDTRFSTTIDFCKSLSEKIPNIWGVDPHVDNNDIDNCGMYPSNLDEGFEKADAVVVMTNHKEWRNLQLNLFQDKVNQPCLILDHWQVINKKNCNKSVFSFGGFGINSKSMDYKANYLKK